MSLQFNMNRPPLSDEEINKGKDFDQLVKSFKEQSLKKAQGDESWWKNKKIRYTTIIAGVTVVCTITYLSLLQSKKTTTHNTKHETLTTSSPKTKPNSPLVKAPLPKLSTGYTKYTIQAGSGGKITHPSSTKISIPKNALVNKEGKQLIGEVTIEYKEMHDMGDVILNGIPMQYDSAGTTNCLETAGMFDIRAYQNGEPVFIKPGEEIKVELASKNPVDKFNQYYLDTIKKNWVYLQRDNLPEVPALEISTGTITSPEMLRLKREVEIVIPRKQDSVENKYAKAISVLSKPVEPRKPQKATGKRPEFTIDADTKDFPELAAYNNTIFEVGTENRNYSPELHDITWNDVHLLPGPQKGINYILQLSYRKRVEKLVVYPVLKGVDFENAQAIYDRQFKTYSRLLEERQNKEKQLMQELQQKQQHYLSEQKRKQEEYEKEQLRLKLAYERNRTQQLMAGFSSVGTMAKVERVFSISQFGIYNSDCPHAIPQGKTLQPVFVLKEKGHLVLPDRIYLIDYSSKTVMGYDGMNPATRISVDEGNSYGFCVFKNGKAYVCDQKVFKKALETNSKEYFVNPLPSDLDDPGEFKKLLEI